MTGWTRRTFLRRAGLAAGTALSIGSLAQHFSAPVGAQTAPVGLTLQTEDAALTAARSLIAASTSPVTSWDGPTSGPAGQPGKFIVYPSQDQRNGGALGVGTGVEEA